MWYALSLADVLRQHGERVNEAWAVSLRMRDAASGADVLMFWGVQFWRHIAMVMDEVTDNVRWYLDGELAWEGPWGSAVSEVTVAHIVVAAFQDISDARG